MELPTAPTYVNDAGQPVYMLEATHKRKRLKAGDVRVLVIHHSGGRDSRLYLAEPPDGRIVSSHYLVGAYPDTDGPRVYKYASETHDCTYTQGFGVMGGMTQSINDVAISIEVEGPPFDAAVLTEAAALARSILDYWREMGPDLVMVGHKHIDSRKPDPSFLWLDFCKMVYG
jgi:N-acetyl-anhydromuramyl-L-alanine amidase AmpD